MTQPVPATGKPVSSSRKKRVSLFRRNPVLLIGCILLVVAAMVGTLPFTLMLQNGNEMREADLQHDEEAKALSAAARRKQWDAAVRYNERLYKSGQPVLGKIVDPFTAAPDENIPLVKDYKRQLTLPADGVMSIIRYPRLSINLPVRHGTDLAILQKGAGHLYGTSLPVGGVNTRTVISAHSGLADKVMFDRLDGLGGQARKGDIFYLTTLGRDLAYKVIDIRVVDPGDFSRLRIVPGRDLATLLTCTPYGINTKRLLVTGTRVKIPAQAPPVSKAPFPLTWLWWLLGILAVLILAISAAVHVWRSTTISRPRRAVLHLRGYSSYSQGR